MRNKFFQHYILSDKEHIKNIWNDSLIVLDANVLLNLYRYSEETKDRLFDVLEHYKDRLWIPYQVGWEYHQNRISVYTDMNAAYDQISDAISKETSKFINGLNLSKYSRHPKIDTKWFENQIKVFMSGLQDKLHSMKDSSVDYSVKDEINERISELLDGKVGDDFDAAELKETYKEGQIRYSEKIPPGYCDVKEKKDQGNRHLYGDLIWWKQVIKEAHKRKSNVILITDDVKEDWYHRVGGKTIGPRKELLKEFRATTQMDVLIYPTSKFLEYAKENMSVSVDQNTISEANDIQRENEAIGDVMSSVSEENEDEVIKIFSENPWMSAESFLQSYLKTFEDPSATALKYSDNLGKDYLSPLENLAKLTADHSAIFGKSALNPAEGLAAATTRVSDILGKDYLNPLENLAKLTPDYSAIFDKNALNPVEGLGTLFSSYPTPSRERKDDKSTDK